MGKDNEMKEREDVINLNIGAEAYQKGDYETAIKYYEKSANAGNVIALSNLGYCYYYGRSIPVDKQKNVGRKRQYWVILLLFINWVICIAMVKLRKISSIRVHFM